MHSLICTVRYTVHYDIIIHTKLIYLVLHTSWDQTNMACDTPLPSPCASEHTHYHQDTSTGTLPYDNDSHAHKLDCMVTMTTSDMKDRWSYTIHNTITV